jgi:predicted nuclease of predicted toxin-antitoxin system
VKLLFDQNPSPKLVHRLADLFLGSAHVQDVGLDQAGDDQVWEYARQNGFVVVTKDEDYDALSVLLGSPPKVIHLLLGNCPTRAVEAVIRKHAATIFAFESDPGSDILTLL